MVHLAALPKVPGFPSLVLVPKSLSVSKTFFFWGCRRLMGHVFLRSLCPWACFSELSISQLILSYTSRGSPPWFWQLLSILVQSFSGLLRGSSHRGWTKLPLLFSSFSKAQGLPIHELGLPFTYFKWALAYGLRLSILKGSIVLDFNTCNILDLNI